jgi:hypothetical protein
MSVAVMLGKQFLRCKLGVKLMLSCDFLRTNDSLRTYYSHYYIVIVITHYYIGVAAKCTFILHRSMSVGPLEMNGKICVVIGRREVYIA